MIRRPGFRMTRAAAVTAFLLLQTYAVGISVGGARPIRVRLGQPTPALCRGWLFLD